MKRFTTAIAPLVAIFWMAAKRLWLNRRLGLGLLVGFTVAVAAAASIPVYAAGALQRVLQADLAAAGKPMPAGVNLWHTDEAKRPTTPAQYVAADRLATQQGGKILGLATLPLVQYAQLDVAATVPVDPLQVNPGLGRWMAPAFLSDLPQHVQILDGRAPQAGLVNGAYEAMVLDQTLDAQDFRVGAEFWVPVSRKEGAPRVKIRVVGAFQRRDPQGPYWFAGSDFEQLFFVHPDSFRQGILLTPGVQPYAYAWYWGIASDQIRMTDASRLLAAMYDLEGRVAQVLPDTTITSGPQELLGRYMSSAASLQLMLLWLAVPVLAILAYYLVVTSGLMVEGQRQEIAVLRSRGASLAQVAGLYLLEGVLLAAGSLLLGWPLGIVLAKAIGSVSGFLQFVIRPPVPLMLPPAFFTYGLAAAAVAVLAYLLPALVAARESITSYKQESARGMARPLWSLLGLDLVCLGLAAYGYYSLQKSHAALLALQAKMAAAGQSLGDTQLIEPLHILGPVLLVLGGGLLVVRLLPWLARLVAALLGRIASAPLYLTLTQLSRAPRHYTPVVLLLTLTVGMGLYSAAAARTMEQNTADRLAYARGADVVMSEVWDAPPAGAPPGAPPGAPAAAPGAGSQGAAPPTPKLNAPPWQAHAALPGVVQAAQVRTQEIFATVGGKPGGKGKLMAINPQDFGQVAWFRRDLAPYHINAYLNLLASRPEGVLVSRAFMTRNRLKPGDHIGLAPGNGQDISLEVLAAIDYWPSLYPQNGDFFIANLPTIEDGLGIQHYDVWLKMQAGAPVTPVVDALRAQKIFVLSLDDTRQALIQARRDPGLGGLLGGLTNGFLLAAAITVLGFWLYAALSARARVLQFGVLRAMGLSVPQLIGAVALEQVIAASVGVAAGTGLGVLAANLFVPFMQQGADAASHTPPFAVVTSSADRLRLYAVLLVMLVIGLGGLMSALSRLRIHEAVKLGEDL